MNKNTIKKYPYFITKMNKEDIQEMYKANEEFVIPEELKEIIQTLADK